MRENKVDNFDEEFAELEKAEEEKLNESKAENETETNDENSVDADEKDTDTVDEDIAGVVVGEVPEKDDAGIEDVEDHEKEASITFNISGWDEVKKFLEVDIDFKDKLIHLSKCESVEVATFASFFLDYDVAMSKGVESDSIGGKLNTRLYNQIMKVLREKDETVFKIKFDLINLVFKRNIHGSYDEFKCCRYSTSTASTKVALNTYHILVVIISSLADRQHRDKNKKAFTSLTNVNNLLTLADISRIKRYYEM